ncbi:MAG: c-type cytochrome biogenesis protein CcmF, partial [Rhodoferax sp.]|nr:c-type cytochrome biogenesis protein CcmF [Rhodoferax sp.]
VWGHLRAAGGPWRRVLQRGRQVPRATAGMWLAHLGIAVFCWGVAMVRSYELERDVKMAVGDRTEVLGHQFRFLGVEALRGPNYLALRGRMEVLRDGRRVTEMFPEKRVYEAQQSPMTEAAIDVGLTRDLYVSLGEPLQDGSWIVRVYVKPFVDWIWGGCALMVLGGLLAVSDRRYRRSRATASQAALPTEVRP